MCRIGITLNTTSPDGTFIESAIYRYRLINTTSWNTFPLDLNNPQTRNITQLGNYELQVRVVNNLGAISDWASGTFTISENCGGILTPIPECTRYQITNINGGSSVPINFIDCEGVPDDIGGGTIGNDNLQTSIGLNETITICGILPTNYESLYPGLEFVIIGRQC